jgi:hypothetical protein
MTIARQEDDPHHDTTYAETLPSRGSGGPMTRKLVGVGDIIFE